MQDILLTIDRKYLQRHAEINAADVEFDRGDKALEAMETDEVPVTVAQYETMKRLVDKDGIHLVIHENGHVGIIGQPEKKHLVITDHDGTTASYLAASQAHGLDIIHARAKGWLEQVHEDEFKPSSVAVMAVDHADPECDEYMVYYDDKDIHWRATLRATTPRR